MKEHIEKTILYIKKNLKEDLSVEKLAKFAGYSICYFSRLFKEIMGESVMFFIRRLRLEKASIELVHGTRNVLQVALDYGFKTQTGFLKAFKKQYGVTPTVYKQLHTLK